MRDGTQRWLTCEIDNFGELVEIISYLTRRRAEATITTSGIHPGSFRERADYDRPLISLLRSAKCEFRRQGKGSHHIWWSPITKRNFPVPRGIYAARLANGILKKAGLPKAF
jgi:hypothetical protein